MTAEDILLSEYHWAKIGNWSNQKWSVSGALIFVQVLTPAPCNGALQGLGCCKKQKQKLTILIAPADFNNLCKKTCHSTFRYLVVYVYLRHPISAAWQAFLSMSLARQLDTTDRSQGGFCLQGGYGFRRQRRQTRKWFDTNGNECSSNTGSNLCPEQCKNAVPNLWIWCGPGLLLKVT